MHMLFTHVLGAHFAPGTRLIEIGCGGSRWLPYFHRAFGYDVSGIHYTLAGTQLAQAILDKAEVSGQIVHGDLFETPPDWLGQFDVAVSFGLVEHFKDTAGVIAACARYLRPGGRMITLVPTMRGLHGAAYRILRPSVYGKHVPHSLETLGRAHTDAGLDVICSDYLLGLPAIISAPSASGVLARMAFSISQLYWKLEQTGWAVPPNRYTSPYAICVADKPNVS